MRAWRVFYRRQERLFVVVGSSGVEIWRCDDIEDAWLVADELQGARDRRNRDRRAEADASAVRAGRLRLVAA